MEKYKRNTQPLSKVVKNNHRHHHHHHNKPYSFKRRLIPYFPFEMLNEKLHRSFCGFEDFGISKRREQKPMCFVSSGFNCFGFKLSSKMVLPSACTCTWDVFCFASLRRLKKGPGFYQFDIILV